MINTITSKRFVIRKSLIGKKIIIIGCGAQGLNQGLNMRDSGLDISYALRESAIKMKRQSFVNVMKNNFAFGLIQDLVPDADVVEHAIRREMSSPQFPGGPSRRG